MPGYEEHLASVDHLVIGRGTYEKVLTFGFWPYPKQHVIVLSRTLATDDSRIHRGDVHRGSTGVAR